MAKTTDLPFDGGAIVVPSGETTSAQVHNVFLREITITDTGRESQIYALFDMNKPTTTAPYFEPVSAFNLAEWVIRGDVIQVDLAEVMAQNTNRYSGVLQDITLSNDSESGLYVSACTLRTMVKRNSTTVRFSWFSLYLIMDQETSISYLATPMYGSPTTMNVPDHKVKIGDGYTNESPNYLAYKILGDGSTVRVEVIDEDILGNPVDPFLRISTIGSSGDGKVLVDYLDDDSDYLANKVSGAGGIVAQVKVVDGYRYIEIAPDSEAQDPLAKMSDLEKIVESRTFESMPVGTVSSSVQNLHDSTGKMTISLCHPVMDFDIRKEVMSDGVVTQQATKASIYISNLDPSANPAQKVRIVVFKGIQPPGYGQWRFALVAYTDEVEIVNSLFYSSHGKSGDDLKHGILDLPIIQVYGGDDDLFQTPVDKYTVKSTEDMYLGIIATGTTLECPGSEYSGTPKNDMPRLVSSKTNMNNGWDPADFTYHTKDIDVNSTSIPDGKRVYVELHNT